MVFSTTTPPTLSVYVNYVLSVVGVRGMISYNIWSIHLEQTRNIQRHRNHSASLFVEIYSQSEYTKDTFSFPVVHRSIDGSWSPLIEASQSHTDTPHSAGLLWTRDLYLTTHNTHKRRNSMPPRRDSNPQSQHASGSRSTAWPLGSAISRMPAFSFTVR